MKAKPQAHGRDPKSTRPVVKPATRHPGEVRLIGGLYRGRKLPVADRPGLRPTPDRVRETLFNWLGQDLDGWRVLDAFAGSGALGFEAASRGAAEVLMLEVDAALVASLRASRERLGVTALKVERAEAMRWMAGCAPQRFEAVLLDPPFDTELGATAAAAAARIVVPGGFVYLEGSEPLAEPPPGLTVHRSMRAGAVHAQLFLAAS
ncbi:MAG: 16S rRNA (guanine(966)-N(2))-methyltransferase RsmD [Betaproteobacteria bacterium]|nr:16S rRNA (guanine(966)-N(2))-methyltransferase RsmD [Betaproteobacteria bacterium]